MNSAVSSCKSSFVPFGCNPFTVLTQLFDFPQCLGHCCWGRSETRREFVQSIRASVGYLRAAGLELDPNRQHRAMCDPGDRAKPRTKDRHTYSITQVRAKSKPRWDSWGHGQGMGRGPRWGWSGPLRAIPTLGALAPRNQRMRMQSDCRAQELMKNCMWLDSKPGKKGKWHHVEIPNEKVGLELRGDVKIHERWHVVSSNQKRSLKKKPNTAAKS